MNMELIDRDRAIRIAEQGQVKGFEWQFKQLVTEPPVKAIPLEKLEQIRAEIESRLQGVNITLEILVKDDALIPRMEAAKTTLEEVLDIFDKAIKEQEEWVISQM